MDDEPAAAAIPAIRSIAPGPSTRRNVPAGNNRSASGVYVLISMSNFMGARDRMLEICGLTKRYGGITAVQNVSFTLSPGEILGYAGPNGAGKSTTVKMIIGLLEPSEAK